MRIRTVYFKLSIFHPCREAARKKYIIEVGARRNYVGVDCMALGISCFEKNILVALKRNQRGTSFQRKQLILTYRIHYYGTCILVM